MTDWFPCYCVIVIWGRGGSYLYVWHSPTLSFPTNCCIYCIYYLCGLDIDDYFTTHVLVVMVFLVLVILPAREVILTISSYQKIQFFILPPFYLFRPIVMYFISYFSILIFIIYILIHRALFSENHYCLLCVSSSFQINFNRKLHFQHTIPCFVTWDIQFAISELFSNLILC